MRFAECYSRNPLVSAFTLGIMQGAYLLRPRGWCRQPGDLRRGQNGAGWNSRRDDGFGRVWRRSASKRPTVQVGDPFLEKLLLEACLEAMRAGAIVGIQDMGAAGLTSSSCEMGLAPATALR